MDLSQWHLWFKRRGGRQLRTLLMNGWDPIGVRGVPEAFDEYDAYVARIADSLRRGADVGQVAAMLSAIRTYAMSIAANPAVDASVATAIVEWYTRAMRDEEAGGWLGYSGSNLRLLRPSSARLSDITLCHQNVT